MKLCYISDEYINFLKETSDNIMDNTDDNPCGKRVYLGPLFPIGDLKYYAPISNGYDHIIEKDGKLQIDDNLGPVIIMALDDEFLGSIEIGKMIPGYDVTLLDIDDIIDKDYQELLKLVEHFIDENRIEIKQYAYAIYNNQKEGKN